MQQKYSQKPVRRNDSGEVNQTLSLVSQSSYWGQKRNGYDGKDGYASAECMGSPSVILAKLPPLLNSYPRLPAAEAKAVPLMRQHCRESSTSHLTAGWLPCILSIQKETVICLLTRIDTSVDMCQYHLQISWFSNIGFRTSFSQTTWPFSWQKRHGKMYFAIGSTAQEYTVSSRSCKPSRIMKWRSDKFPVP